MPGRDDGIGYQEDLERHIFVSHVADGCYQDGDSLCKMEEPAWHDIK